MPQPLLSKKTFIGIKSETTQGTALAPSASTDYLLAMDVEIKPNIEILERDYVNSFLDRRSHSIGKKYSTLKFKTELKGTGTVDTPEAGFTAALQACGLINATGLFSPVSTYQSGMQGPAISATIYVFRDGLLHSMAGSIGNVKFTLEAGKIGFAEFEFSGSYIAVSSTSNPTPTFDTTSPPICYSSTLTLVGVATEIASKIEIDLGNTIAQRDDVNSANGILGFTITGRSSKGSIDPEVIDAAAWTKLVAGTSGNTVITLGSVTGNKIVFTMAATQYTDLSYGDRSGILTHNANLAFNQSSGNDCITVNFN